MEHLEGILKLVDNELEAINRNGKFKSREEIDSVYKLIDIVKDVNKIWCMEEEMSGEGEVSYVDGGSYRGGGRAYRGNSYDDGMSYARGRGRNARRDSMGRYTSRDGGRSMRGYAYGDGEDEYKDQLMSIMQNAQDEQTRQSIKRMLDQM